MRIGIVDDEPKIRRALRRMVEELNEGGEYAIVGEAAAGHECLDLAANHPIDLLFLDIVLPGPSGLEVLAELRNRGWKGQVVMVSGHNDFAYVKQALQQEAVDYILKPFDRPEIEQALGKAKERLIQQMNEQLSVQQLKRMQHESDFRALLESKRKLYDGQPLTPDELVRFPLLLAADTFRIRLLVLPDYLELLDRRFRMDRRLLAYALEMFIRDALDRLRVRDTVVAGRSEKYEWCWFLITPADSDAAPCTAIAEALREIFRVETILFEGADAVKRDGISVSLQRLEQRALYADMTSLRESRRPFPLDAAAAPGIPGPAADKLADFAKKVQHLHKFGLLHRVAPEVESLFDTLRRHRQVSVMTLYQAWTALHHASLPVAMDTVEQAAARFGWDADRAEALFKRELERNAAAARASLAFIDDRTTAVKEYIDLFYHQELTLAGLAEQFFISKEYLAARFKQVFGCTVVRYIHRRRLETAKELLRQGDLSISSVASAVGFDHFSYFNKIFKREYGITPTQFREAGKRTES